MKPDGNINLDLILQQAESIVATNIQYVFICGTTGESLSLSLRERKSIADKWSSVISKGTLPLSLIVHVGAESLEDARELARHSKAVGAKAIAAMSTAFFKPATIDNLVQLLAAIADEVNLPFYYYHIPSMNGLPFMMYQFVPEAIKQIPTFAGLKFTDTQLNDLALVANMGVNIVMGEDEMLLSALSMGAEGAVGSTYNFNFAVPIYQNIISAFKAGDMATALKNQVRIDEMVAIISDYPLTPALKAVLNMTGIDVGPPRLPWVPLSSAQYNELYQRLKDAGFLDL